MSRPGFSGQLKAFADQAKLRHQAVFVGTVTEIERSIMDGSEITGAPGQPVQTGNLRGSFAPPIFETPTLARVATNVVYAPEIEEGARNGNPLTLRSEVGGFHSVALTIAGFPAIVEHEAERFKDVTLATAPTPEGAP